MWKEAGGALKRFWSALSGGKYAAGATGPVNFENLQPIPVVNVMEYGADDGDKAPKMYVPVNSSGVKSVHDSILDTVDARIEDLVDTTQMGTPTITGWNATNAILQKMHRRLGVVAFTSDAAGNLAADVELVPATAGYYGVIEWRGLFSLGNAGGVATLVVDPAIDSLVSGTLAAGQLDTVNAGMILYTGTDNSSIYIDTTSSGLGNTQSYKAIFEYWYET